jgi:transcription elongation factor Elf1
MTEHEFQKHILQAFDGHPNIMLYRRNTGAATIANPNGKKRFIRFSEAGQSDIWGVIKAYRCPFCNKVQYGVHLEIELKVGKNKMTERQREWLQQIDRFNGIAMELRPSENDPVGLRERICRLIERFRCPECTARATI